MYFLYHGRREVQKRKSLTEVRDWHYNTAAFPTPVLTDRFKGLSDPSLSQLDNRSTPSKYYFTTVISICQVVLYILRGFFGFVNRRLGFAVQTACDRLTLNKGVHHLAEIDSQTVEQSRGGLRGRLGDVLDQL